MKLPKTCVKVFDLAKKSSVFLQTKKQTPAVDLDTYRELPKDEGIHSWIDELHLMDVDKTVVMSGNWINAAIINASQYILNKQFEAKFQDVGYAMTMNYSIVERKANNRIMVKGGSRAPFDPLLPLVKGGSRAPFDPPPSPTPVRCWPSHRGGVKGDLDPPSKNY